MSALYVAEVAIVLAAIPAMFWLRRVSDRSWARFMARRRRSATLARIAQFHLALAAIGPAMASVAKAAAECDAAMRRLRDQIRNTT